MGNEATEAKTALRVQMNVCGTEKDLIEPGQEDTRGAAPRVEG